MNPLVNTPEWVDGRLCHRYVHDGREVLVCDSAKNVLLVIELFADPLLTELQKLQLLLLMLFPSHERVVEEFPDLGALIKDVVWQMCGLDVSGENNGERKVFDWEQDAARIKTSLLMAYGLDWDVECTRRSYLEMCDLLAMLLESQTSTPFSEAVRYRVSDPPEGNKYNQKERERFLSMRKHFALDGEGEDDADAIFDRIWKEVTHE